ncbi:carboxylesterase family protein [Nonomuraea rubra]|uniref:carboxylesterase family protein n=1 Tax=Nonomuraea rubra TaxID=46180 RepID=UPI0033C25FC3
MARPPVGVALRKPRDAGCPKPSFPAAAQHMAELPYLFDLALFEKLSPQQARLGDRLIATWTRFARAGDPNGAASSPGPFCAVIAVRRGGTCSP